MDNIEEMKEALLSDCKEGKKPSRPMGIGELVSPDIVIIRKFRWTLNGTNLNESFVKSVKFDFVKKEIHARIMEVVAMDRDDIDVHRWLESNWMSESLVFTTYDGCGVPIYEYKFTDLELLEDTAEFDYSVSDESERVVRLKYNDLTRTFLLKPKEDGTKRLVKRFYWKVQVEGTTEMYNVKVTHRPALEVEETEVNFLNAKTWIPGKTSWHPINFTLDRQHDMSILSPLIQIKRPTLLLHLYGTDGDSVIETWKLRECVLTKMLHKENAYDLSVRVGGIDYTCATYEEKRNE